MKIGIEIEGFVYNNQQRVDVYQVFGEGEVFKGIGVYKTDAGKHQLEIALEPVRTSKELKELIKEALSQLPFSWTIFFEGTDPYSEDGEELPWAPKPRYKALRKALEIEAGPSAKGVREVSRFSSTHFHIGIDPFSEEGLKLLNCLNRWAPFLAVLFAHPYPSYRLRKCWWGWGNNARLPGYRFFKSQKELKETLFSLPQLVKVNKDKEWLPYLKPPKELTSLHLGTIYWWVRPRPDYGTVEFRPFDALPPPLLIDAFETMRNLIDFILSSKKNLPSFPEYQWWQMISHQDKNLAQRFFMKIKVL